MIDPISIVFYNSSKSNSIGNWSSSQKSLVCV